MGDRYPAQLSGGQRQRVSSAWPAPSRSTRAPDAHGRARGATTRPTASASRTGVPAPPEGAAQDRICHSSDIDEAIRWATARHHARRRGALRSLRRPLAPAAHRPRRRLRRGLRGRRPRAQAPRAPARPRSRPVDRPQGCRAGEATTSHAEAPLRRPRSLTLLLVDGDERPLGWLSERDLATPVVPQTAAISPEPIVDQDDILSDALSDLLAVGDALLPGRRRPWPTSSASAPRRHRRLPARRDTVAIAEAAAR